MEAGVVPIMIGPVNGTVGDTDLRLVGVTWVEEKVGLEGDRPAGGDVVRRGGDLG